MNTKMKKGLVGVGLFAGLMVGGFAQAADSGWSSGFELDLNSKYIWRSLAWSEGTVLQPSVWVASSGLMFSVWSNFVLNNEPNRRQFNEIDFRISYEMEVGGFSIVPAFTYYSYPNQDKMENPATGELEIQVAYGMGDFTLETTHFLDVWENKGGYVGEVGLEFEKDSAEGLNIAAAARVVLANSKFNAFYVPYEKGALNALVLEAGLTYSFPNGLYLRPHFEWNNILDKNLRAAVEASDWISIPKPNLFNFGVALGFDF
jgi:hypothetical protein